MQKCIEERWNDIQERDISAVEKYLRNEPIAVIDGGILAEFERAFADFVGTRYAVAFCNGTAALHAASFAIGAQSNSNIICSAYSYHGTVNSALENNARILLCNYDIKTLNVDCDAAERAIESDTLGIIVTHCWGNPADMDRLKEIKDKYKIKIISDASHAHGAKWGNQNIGSLDVEDVACFSLGKNKLISAGELGVAVTNDEELYNNMLFIGHPNRVPYALTSQHLKEYSNGIGNKYRPHVLGMVLALQQLKRYQEKLEANITTNNYLVESIKGIPGFIPVESYDKANRVYWKLHFKLDPVYWEGVPTEKIVVALQDEGLPLQQVHNYNIQEQNNIWTHPRYSGKVINLSSQPSPLDMIVLPGFIKISNEDADYIVRSFNKVSSRKGDFL